MSLLYPSHTASVAVRECLKPPIYDSIIVLQYTSANRIITANVIFELPPAQLTGTKGRYPDVVLLPEKSRDPTHYTLRNRNMGA